METGQIIILVAYFIGYLITFYFQKQKIDSLENRINSQAGILSDMKTYIGIFDIDKIKKTTDWLIEAAEKKADEKIRSIEKEAKSKDSKGEKIFDENHIEFIRLIAKLAVRFSKINFFENSINEMIEGEAKELSLFALENSREKLKEQLNR